MSQRPKARACLRLHCMAPATLNDEQRRRFEVLEPSRIVCSVHVAVALEAERPQVTVRLSGEAFVGRVMKLNALIGSAGGTSSVESREVLALAFGPLRRLQVATVFGGVPHGSRSCRSPQLVPRTSTDDDRQRTPMKGRKP